MLVPTALHQIVNLPEVGPLGALAHVEGFRRDIGRPADPIERMLAEQLLLAHHRLTRLHTRADAANHPEHVRVLNAACVRLLGEFRRLALAIRQYRAPLAPRSFAVVHQQNVVAGGDGGQQVTYVDRSVGGQEEVSLSVRGGLEGNAGSDDPIGGTGGRIWAGEEPAARGGRAAERLQATGVDA